MKVLKKSNNKVICGVCGGLGEYLNFDATIIRLIICIITVFGVGSGVVIYILAALIMPPADSQNLYSDDVDNLKSANISEEEVKSSEKADNASAKPKASGGHSDEDFDKYFKK